MNEYIKPLCNRSLATSCVQSAMASSSEEGRVATPFTEGVSNSAERELSFVEDASTVSLAPNLCVVPDPSVAVQEGKECIRDILDHSSGKESAAGHLVFGGEADYKDS